MGIIVSMAGEGQAESGGGEGEEEKKRKHYRSFQSGRKLLSLDLDYMGTEGGKS